MSQFEQQRTTTENREDTEKKNTIQKDILADPISKDSLIQDLHDSVALSNPEKRTDLSAWLSFRLMVCAVFICIAWEKAKIPPSGSPAIAAASPSDASWNSPSDDTSQPSITTAPCNNTAFNAMGHANVSTVRAPGTWEWAEAGKSFVDDIKSYLRHLDGTRLSHSRG